MIQPQQYSGDAPASHPEQDEFRRWPFGQRIAQVIAGRRDPSSIAIGIYGAWGEGKTTLLNFIEHELRGQPNVVSFRFNPWRFPAEDQLLIAFFNDLAKAVDRSLATGQEKVADAVRQFGGPWAKIVGRGELADGVADLIGAPDLPELRQRIEAILQEAGKRVVILMDDIDRLDNDEIHAVFRLVKLTADFQNTAYVLAFDAEVVASALQSRYGAQNSNAGRAFLEKIVQVPLHLPAVDSSSLRRFYFACVDQALAEGGIELAQQEVQEFVRHFTKAFDVRLRTPRQAKLYGNILSFSLPILKGEVNPVDLMLVEGMRVFYPQLYVFVRNNSAIALGIGFTREHGGEARRETARNLLEGAMSDLEPSHRSAAQALLVALFPQLGWVLGGTHYGSDWDETWAKSKRIASRDYFVRYFSYAVPEGDISDQAIADVIAVAGDGSVEDTSRVIREILSSGNAATFIAKLRRHEDEILSTAARPIALALAGLGDRLPATETLFSYTNPRSQAGILIAALIKAQSDNAGRQTLAEGVVRTADPLTFAAECFRWLWRYDEERPDPKAFSSEDIDIVGRVAAERIALESERVASLLIQYGKEAQSLLYLWHRHGLPGQARSYLANLIAVDPQEAVALLKCFLPTAWGMESGISRDGDFQRSQYNAVREIVDPILILQALKDHFDEEFVVPEAYVHREDEGAAGDLRVAIQFGWIHQYVTNEKASHSASANPESS